jgi:ADP-dependent NAD(P)H-hydrate dehydratase / NAD(P)H-hydrate epimerase
MKITTADEMRTIDRVSSERHGVHSLALMESAGSAVAAFAKDEWPHAERITVICGKGNNGGDGFVVARKLHQAGRVIEVLLLGDPSELKGDAANMFGRLPVRPVVIRSERDLQNELSRSIGNANLIVDAILGTGFTPPVTGLVAAAIEGINKTTAPVLSIDIPSGAVADSYTPESGPYCRSDAIVTFTAPRPAHLFGQLTRGPLVVAPIGSPEQAIVSALNLEAISSADIDPLLAPRPLDSNKGRYGHVLVVGGSLGKAGAAAMAGMGALRAGAGLATVAVPRSVFLTVASFAPELMTEPLPETQQGSISLSVLEGTRFNNVAAGKTVLALGPGLSRHAESAQFARALFQRTQTPIVVDADGLNAFESNPSELAGAGRVVVITPHPGEMARLTGKSIAQVQADRIGCARAFAQEHSCIVVLKGHRTIVALPGGAAFVNPTGNAGMATGGTGDILTGLVAGFLAQFPENPARAVCAAVFLHGMAGDCARDAVGEQSMVATDLLRFTSEAFRRSRHWATAKLLRLN